MSRPRCSQCFDAWHCVGMPPMHNEVRGKRNAKKGQRLRSLGSSVLFFFALPSCLHFLPSLLRGDLRRGWTR